MKIYGVIGWKNSGKTGLMERLVAEITARGLKVSTIKHAHHVFDVDQKGKDSFRHRAAGAGEVLLASHKRWALMHELGEDHEPSLDVLLAKLDPCDLVLVEGYKRDNHPKIEVMRQETTQGLIALEDRTVRAVAANTTINDVDLPLFDLDDTNAIADFILDQVGLGASARPPPTSAKPAPLKDDCFALPPGVDWTPVDVALDHLHSSLGPVTGHEEMPVASTLNRVLAVDHLALRSNPPGANSAVDGYGFAHAALPADGDADLPLMEDRAAAGVPFIGSVPFGNAIRILTGALLPEGVDCVVMEEDVTLAGGRISFGAGIKPRANARKAGEDVEAGKLALPAGHVIRPPDIALLSGLGLANAQVHKKLRVGVLSTGDEIVAPGSTLDPAATYDANRPMLLALAEKWGYQAVDLGHVIDNRTSLRTALDDATSSADVILTSGGASAGDEDHVSAILSEEGSLNTWRVALKPGRPLVLAMWHGIPVFGLPGNPVAALVTTLIFARPALSVLAGAGWSNPMRITLPAAFTKSKKAGRREYLRARVNADGAIEVFQSEGSGRISGLSWASGLVELNEPAQDISPGDQVSFLPYAGFGL
ncbi:MAG: bifunctional molybdopterin-guanine dinucleotide biosynthesis adaptor protein MobB/molybdopterin molybdotransferase MoeA [Rhodobacteraceae bacterium]|nr:bifunctional molybdopterin-guanine dinucleotide biosynthesis adaptor protein MobB/molybdopterin molybdotransferase MoeA [Paracoccaceae bacterium]